MPLPVVALFIAALLTVVLVLIGWSQDPGAPTLGGWFFAKATEGGLWSGLLLFLVAVGFFTWRGRRADGDGSAPPPPPRGGAGRDDPEG